MIELEKSGEKKFDGEHLDDFAKDHKKSDYSVVALADLALLSDGLSTPDGTFKMSEVAMKQLLKRIDPPISTKYAWGVKNEQLLYDVNEIFDRSEVGLMLRRTDDIITGVMKDDFSPISNLGLVNKLINGNYNVNSITVAPHLMKINIITDVDIEPKKGDISKVGMEILNSECGWTSLQSALLLYRVICSNGAIVKESAYTYKQKQIARSEDAILGDFILRIGDYTWQAGGIGEALARMTETKTQELDILPRRAIPIMSTDDHVVGIDALSKLVKGIVGKDDSDNIMYNLSDDNMQYDVYNSITAAAKQYSVDKSRRLENLGGVMISYNMARLAA
jgi:hypothetical protein